MTADVLSLVTQNLEQSTQEDDVTIGPRAAAASFASVSGSKMPSLLELLVVVDAVVVARLMCCSAAGPEAVANLTRRIQISNSPRCSRQHA